MNILITGVAGFIGHLLADKLLADGESVWGIDNGITGQISVVQKLLQHKNFHFIQGDIRSSSIWKKVSEEMRSCDQIFHLACPTGVPNCVAMPLEMLLTSSIGTRMVADFAMSKNAKILFTSSSEVYGDPHVFPQSETYWGNVDPTGLRSPYEEGKRYAESLLLSYAKKRNGAVVIARLFNVYGPGMARSETRVIPRLIQQALKNEEMSIYGSGTQTRTFCYVDDIIKGLLTLMAKGATGQVYNLGSDTEITVNNLAVMIQKLTKTKSQSILTAFSIPDHKRRLPDSAKIKKLGWRQTVPLETGLQKTIEYFSLSVTPAYKPESI